ncbi:MAG TPA: hypothetical protein VGV92_09650 [Gammaproteobacteria bacterium]|nr:hypothetical protein [Gammaproteobacteria bacterium]
MIEAHLTEVLRAYAERTPRPINPRKPIDAFLEKLDPETRSLLAPLFDKAFSEAVASNTKFATSPFMQEFTADPQAVLERARAERKELARNETGNTAYIQNQKDFVERLERYGRKSATASNTSDVTLKK